MRWLPLADGEVLIAGGFDGSNVVQGAELFDPSTDTFTALPASGSSELQSAREGAVAAPLPVGQVLIAGGFDAQQLPAERGVDGAWGTQCLDLRAGVGWNVFARAVGGDEPCVYRGRWRPGAVLL